MGPADVVERASTPPPPVLKLVIYLPQNTNCVYSMGYMAKLHNLSEPKDC